MKSVRLLSLFAALSLLAQTAIAYDQIVVKKEFNLASYVTVGGKTIRNLRVGYEYYGTLNAKKDNVILVAHHFSGSSHAAGKYAVTDASGGYWDSIIGPGKALDTSKYFIISSDTLVNINPRDPNVITTGPLSVNPDTGKIYGTNFPVVTYQDFVRVQKALLDSLGIARLHAVAGPSAGSMQALQWAADYPQMVERVIAVISPGLSTPAYTIGIFNSWASPIMADPKWNQGQYAAQEQPVEGLALAFKAVTLSTVDFAWAEKNFGAAPADPKNLPTDHIANSYKIEAALLASGRAKASVADANSFLYMVRASQAFNVEAKVAQIKAPVLFISSATDALFPTGLAANSARQLIAAGGSAKVAVINGAGGHLVGILGIAGASKEISVFLAR